MKRVHVPAQNSSSSVQMFPYDISGKSEGYLLDTLRCCAVNISANKWPPPLPIINACFLTDTPLTKSISELMRALHRERRRPSFPHFIPPVFFLMESYLMPWKQHIMTCLLSEMMSGKRCLKSWR